MCETFARQAGTVLAMATSVPAKSHRSWYLDTAIANRLAAVVDDIHYRTRRPKHEVLAAAVTIALEHQDAIEARVRAEKEGDSA
ncbi:MAG: hypothetical protein ACRDNF_25630 [Streptosporangiaceae bacterium]